jgi:DNA (cytosine-5)-methyltransferase 1
MRRPRLLDLFCGAGGCSVGYARAGFDVVGVDIEEQPHYPFLFIRADALEYQGLGLFDVIHASPPCQHYSVMGRRHSKNYPDLVGHVRRRLVESGRPYVIENVPGAPLLNPILLCGEMFGLGVVRHRLFESSLPLPQPRHLPHRGPVSCNIRGHRAAGAYVGVYGNEYLADEGRRAMGIDWMPKKYLSQAIPPAYTHFVGRHLRKQLP